jgi:arabinan endo-1,5-alpha-L-arabinosidase
MIKGKAFPVFILATLSITIHLGVYNSSFAQDVNIRVHDPVMIRQDGIYYLFTTGMGISKWKSKDMVQWERDGSVFTSAPQWAVQEVNDFKGHIWAPDIFYHNGLYYLYYSISSFGKNTSAIGVATNPTLHRDSKDYKWSDRGMVIRSVPGRDLWNAIDPHVILDENQNPWMSFGSFWAGIKLFRLNETLDAPAQPQEWYTVAARERKFGVNDSLAGNAAIEAPFIFRKGNHYYLFVSFDFCCRGISSTYKVVVGRSENINGPYLDRLGNDMNSGGGSLVVEGNTKWPGIGHNAVYTFDHQDYMIFHGYDAGDDGRPKLLIRTIQWDKDGWPTVSLN